MATRLNIPPMHLLASVVPSWTQDPGRGQTQQRVTLVAALAPMVNIGLSQSPSTSVIPVEAAFLVYLLPCRMPLLNVRLLLKKTIFKPTKNYRITILFYDCLEIHTKPEQDICGQFLWV
jgi:hypothetical protein